MADLDNFFAKKDKKKKKSTTLGFSKANTEVIVKNLEVQRHRDQEKESEHAVPLATTIGNQASHESTTKLFTKDIQSSNEKDEEWYDYDPDEKDYTGLKIEALQIQDELSKDEETSDANNEISEENSKKDSSSVWSGRVTSNGSQGEVESDNGPSYTPAPAPSEDKAKYVPPEKRNAINVGVMKPRRSKAAPDINSQIYFPSLASSVIPCEDDSRRYEFEEVRGGGSSTHHHKSEAPRLTLDNKFSALRE
ncbi:protein CDV3 homolog [Lepeophtheirus salmonis]|uniref:CDV3 homolog A n=3 Tax=Lepeophtheirus salmonis TaxID=72036 RepID=C1BTH5_LEPSM|nr:protein CDV3 homolog A-like [Lepeophtheirus salmonis]ACO12328.1 CDV3 homolog A [Lepeophtheirus salmonis]ADD38089.1 Protein CDV3 homolog A [Lepeophtheirus salmonis]